MRARRTRLGLALALLTLPRLAGAAPQAVERHVIVSVVDSRRAPVTGLSAHDFIVREDGVAREVVRVSPAPPPSHIVLLVDTSQAAQSFLVDIRAALAAFVRKVTALQPAPAVMLMTVGERPERQTPFTSNAAALQAAVQKVFPRPEAGAYLLDGVMDATRAFASAGAERPVAVAFTVEGGPDFSSVQHQQVAQALAGAHASLWTVDLQNGPAPGPRPGEQRERAMVVGDVTRESGGFNNPLLSPQGLEDAFSSLATLLGSGYDVVYSHPDTLIPPTRRTVETRNAALRVLAPARITP
jgi:VWFA-related protein